jgi:hypothetical protein
VVRLDGVIRELSEGLRGLAGVLGVDPPGLQRGHSGGQVGGRGLALGEFRVHARGDAHGLHPHGLHEHREGLAADPRSLGAADSVGGGL